MVRLPPLPTLLLLTAAKSSAAFCPSSIGSSAFVPVRTHHRATSTSALQMNLFDRFSRVARSNLNNILKNLEDPEKLLNQAVEDMQGDLVKIRQSYAEITATQRRLLKQKEQADALADDWYKRAQLALQKGNEVLAKEALTRRQQQVDGSADLQKQIDVQANAIDKLYDGMQTLDKKIMESRAKKDQMIARARTAQSTQKVNDMLGGITGKTSMDAFSRMEDKVEALEAAAEISAEMGSIGNALPGSSSLEQEFKLLEASSEVDNELRKLKGLLTGGSSETMNGSASKQDAPMVDDEFEKLKREAGL